MKKRINELMDMFPYFFDKSETSNFFKSQNVTNNQLLKIYQSIHDVYDSFQLKKRCLIWKEQTVPYDYNIHFVANYPHLKSVECYKNDTLIYSEEYLEDYEINSFNYTYESTDNITSNPDSPIIPEDTFKIIVETHDEYIMEKGFPENDEILENIYDHDTSLDEIGALNDIPRKTYKSTEDYANTEPKYNNRLSEDDYHYMERIFEYNLRLHNTPLPILEIWKEYGIFSDMVNRGQYLLKMFDTEKQHLDENGEYNPEWTPKAWEHKDLLCDLQPELGKFFFVSANTLLPVKNQSVTFHFKYLNSLVEKLTGDYNVTILLNDEPLFTNFAGEQKVIDSETLADDEPNIFSFIAYEGNRVFATDELTVMVRGCNTADWYVSPNGNDTNTGKSSSSPFATLDKAISMINGEENLIVLTSGTHTTDHTFNVPFSCTILGCGGATISNSNSLRFFKLYQNQSLNIQDVTLVHGDISVLVDNSNFINNNKSNTPLYVLLQEPRGGIILTASAAHVASGDEITITVTVTDEDGEPIEDAEVELYKVTT